MRMIPGSLAAHFFSMEVTAEALNDEQLKLLQNSNIINIEQPEGQFENMRMSTVYRTG